MTKSKKILIKDAYLELIQDIAYDYDGCNTVESLKELVDELVKYADKAIRNETKTEEFIGADGTKYNILHEKIRRRK